MVVPQGTKLAPKTKAVYAWTRKNADGTVAESPIVDAKGKPVVAKTYTAKLATA